MKRARCICGHSFSAHKSCTWKKHERGDCTARIRSEVVIVELDGTEHNLDAFPCACREYIPAKETAA